MVQTCQLCGDKAQKRNMASASTSVWDKAEPPALTLLPNSSIPPFMSLVTFKLLLPGWSSERVSLV